MALLGVPRFRIFPEGGLAMLFSNLCSMLWLSLITFIGIHPIGGNALGTERMLHPVSEYIETAYQTNPPVPLPAIPPPLTPRDVYAAGRPGNFSATVKNFPSLIYVPNSGSSSVDVIDPK